ncbi:hypothetical protein BBF96_05300 [Anoxybacter fermentans]|uniref:DUF3996 domain-containing protein n=1 Tax=Anoxybacter fermentans TaxID=1323375 RepID=A0A3Q9HPS0_9FIRM|nr:hypothetical protein [Anoxybacter fermentans]AZR72855.1 hypothetical protein BBF96_05300 [Anoxybacter fermentans]
MNKVLVILFFCTLLLTLSVEVLAQEKPEYIIGINNFPNFGWAQYNKEGKITGYKGINVLLGYSQKMYFEPGIKLNSFNPFWGLGTVGLIIPYGVVGVEYAIPVDDEKNYFTISAEIGLVLMVPITGIGISYVW